MVSATRSSISSTRVAFLGALLLCGVCDKRPTHEHPCSFLGALLLCGVCDANFTARTRPGVSRSSSALWCLRRDPETVLRPLGF